MSDASDKAETKKTADKPQVTVNTVSPEKVEQPFLQTPQMMKCGAAIEAGQMERFVKSFQQSTQRWEIVVYPALFGFILLATYGFFLIYNLTGNMSAIARSMDPDMGRHMEVMSQSMQQLTTQIQTMTDLMGAISVKLDTLPTMLDHMGKMEKSINHMDNSMLVMNLSIGNMGNSMLTMDKSMFTMNKSIGNMDNSMLMMNKSISNIDDSVLVMRDMSTKLDSLTPMLGQMTKINQSIKEMEESIRYMTSNIDLIRIDLMSMSQNVSRPMSFFNNFAPW